MVLSVVSAKDFNPRPPRGGRRLLQPLQGELYGHFNPRPPRGGRLQIFTRLPFTLKFQSTPPARGATTPARNFGRRPGISIHAPREGGDIVGILGHVGLAISIHAPREGGDTILHAADAKAIQFQSTPPARGATARSAGASWRGWNFNPRPPRGGRPEGARRCCF